MRGGRPLRLRRGPDPTRRGLALVDSGLGGLYTARVPTRSALQSCEVSTQCILASTNGRSTIRDA